MAMIRLLFATSLVFAGITVAAAQPATDPAAELALFRRAIPELQAQRNGALDQVAELAARLALAKDELAKAQARVRELEAAGKGDAPK